MGEKLKLAFQIYVDGFTAFRRCRMHPFVQKMKMYHLLAQKIDVTQWH